MLLWILPNQCMFDPRCLATKSWNSVHLFLLFDSAAPRLQGWGCVVNFWFNGLWGWSFELKLLPWRSDSVSERERGRWRSKVVMKECWKCTQVCIYIGWEFRDSIETSELGFNCKYENGINKDPRIRFGAGHWFKSGQSDLGLAWAGSLRFASFFDWFGPVQTTSNPVLTYFARFLISQSIPLQFQFLNGHSSNLDPIKLGYLGPKS